jgi:RND family efflux transporter MFP subunit
MKAGRYILILVLIAAAWVGGYGYGRWYGPKPAAGGAHQADHKPSGYHCPMHPSFHSDKPGNCGICGMRLVPDDDAAHPAGAPPQAEGAPPASMPMGTINVSPEKQQLIGVRYGTVEMAAGIHNFRAAGKVAADETRVAKVQSKVEGWIDKVHVNFIGKLVEKGQPLLTLYSPEMLATQQEYLLALKSRNIMKGSPLRSSLEQSDSLVVAARRRLELWDLGEAQIEEIARTGEPVKNITLYSPITGYVMERKAFPKQRITPETELYTVVDLSKVWIMADVFQNEAPMIREGMPARVTPSYGGGQTFSARVNYIQPQVDSMTRTLKVRLEADNPALALKPDMFVDVDFQVAMPRRLVVPAEAVLDAGLKKTVFVDRGNGYLEPRQVETGEQIGDRVEITKGLKAGERIVTSGNFLIDSESQLKAAAGGMAGHQHGGPAKTEEKQAPAAGVRKHD